MKKTAGIILAGIISFSAVFATVGAVTVIPVYLNGRAIDFTTENVKPQIFMGRTYVPLRKVCDALGISMDWNTTTKWLTFKRGYTVIEHQVPSNVVYVNGEPRNFDTSSINANGTTLMPIRMLAEAVDANVSWGANTKSVYITLIGAETTTEGTTSVIVEPTVTPKDTTTFESKIAQISSLYADLRDNKANYKTSGVSGKAVVFKDKNNNIRMITLNPSGDGKNWQFTDCYQEYYYSEKGELRFVYTCSQDGKNTENRFYFYGGKLLKTVDQNGKISTYQNGGKDTYGVISHSNWVYETYKNS